jgi:exodeoxyribonuclease V alpha subunit
MTINRKPQQPPSQEFERLDGLVERVTFHNADSGFCVLRLHVKGERELVTLVGFVPSVTPGEYASASGTWITDREHGRQFKAVFVKISPPTTLTGIERYLGSGMVKGIGPVYAARLVTAFGAAVFDTIERTPERLREFDGIGAVRLFTWSQFRVLVHLGILDRRRLPGGKKTERPRSTNALFEVVSRH